MLTITRITKRLTDGSDVVDLELRSPDQIIFLSPDPEGDADQLIDAIAYAIETHTSEGVRVREASAVEGE